MCRGREILHWCLEYDIVIRARHIPVKVNILADRLSRLDRPLKTEWALDPSVANSIGSIGGEFHFPNAQLSQCRFV